MTFLSLPTLLLATALAIPALLLLYFLKLRRQERRISSTLLWRRAVQDLQVNAPFQRLRRNLLLFLQLLILAALIFGLGEPVARFLKPRQRTLVLLLDQSASMKTREESGPRLDLVRQAAATFVENMGRDERAMIIGFADRASVLCPFTRDKRQLQRSIWGLDAADGRSLLAEALQLAVAYTSRIIDLPGAATPVPAAPAADLVLFSDGRIADADEPVVSRGNLTFVPAGRARDNVGIVALDVRRSPADPTQVAVFARVENFGPLPVTTDVSLKLDGRLLHVRELTLAPAADLATRPAAEAVAAARSRDLPAQGLAFEFLHEAGGVLELRLDRDDALAADNAIWAPLEPPRALTLLGVGDRAAVRHFVSRAIAALRGAALSWLTTREYESAAEDALVVAGRSRYDLVILDAHDTARVPPGNYLFLGGVPKIDGVAAEGLIDDQHVVNWDETHPLMRYIVFDNVHVARWRNVRLPSHAGLLVEGETSPVIAQLNEPGRQFVIVAFDLLDSDFPLKVPFVLFMQNVVRTLTAGAGGVARMLRPGETLLAPVPRGARSAGVMRPDGATDRIDLAGRLQLAYARTHDVGVYRVRFDDADSTALPFAVNLLDRTESHVAPVDALTVGAQPVPRIDRVERVNQPLWPWAVAAALLILVVEWWIYNRRVMI